MYIINLNLKFRGLSYGNNLFNFLFSCSLADLVLVKDL
ncbi:hypothetical protein CLK_1768 [Clostridium botulinum A3 str. Loch Maree]|nr:hypothetical protein CLK_1768 [Clostridium botulinum A3 str. Loch Maree]